MHYWRSPYEWDFAVGSFEFSGAVQIPEIYTLADSSRFEKSPLLALGYPGRILRDGSRDDKRWVGAAVAMRHRCDAMSREAESSSDSEWVRSSALQAKQCQLHRGEIFRSQPLPYRYDGVDGAKLGHISTGDVTMADDFVVATDVDGGPGLSGGPLYDPQGDVLIGLVKWALQTMPSLEKKERTSDRLYAPVTAQRLTTRVVESFCANAQDKDLKTICQVLRERMLDD